MSNKVRFMGVEMEESTAAALAGVDGLTAKDSAISAEAERDAVDERMADTLVAFTRTAGRVLASAKPPTVGDLNRMVFAIAADGKCYADYRHAGRPRGGEPAIKFGGFTKSILAAHNVKRFVKLGSHGKILAEAADGRGICEVEHIAYAGQKDSQANHDWARCSITASATLPAGPCSVKIHGDNANRGATYDARKAHGDNGWHVEYADGKHQNVAELDWNPAP